MESTNSLSVYQIIREWKRHNALNYDLTKYGLPVPCGAQGIVFGDKPFYVEPLKVDDVSKEQRYNMNQVERKCHPHEYLHSFCVVRIRILLHYIVVSLICDHLKAKTCEGEVECHEVRNTDLMEQGRTLPDVFMHHF